MRIPITWPTIKLVPAYIETDELPRFESAEEAEQTLAQGDAFVCGDKIGFIGYPDLIQIPTPEQAAEACEYVRKFHPHDPMKAKTYRSALALTALRYPSR